MSTPSPRIFAGIDPGWSGGIALIASDGGVKLIPMPDTEDGMLMVAMALKDLGILEGIESSVYIEKVGGFIGTRPGGGEHRNLASGHSMFKFGHAYGAIRMACVAAGLPPREVTPQTWQKALGIRPKEKGESQASHKRRIKEKAGELFPTAKVTLKTADALCIAEYARRQG